MVAVVAITMLAGCAAQRELAGYPAPTSPQLDAAPWPRLADGPNHARPLGAGPNTAEGAAIAATLTASARAQAAEAERLSSPVFAVQPLREEADAVRALRPAP